MTWAIRAVALAGVAAVLAAAGIAFATAGEDASPVTSGTIAIHFSKFVAPELTVPLGVPVTFTLVNNDPIEHEWIIGDKAAHARHRTGTEPFHDQVQTEVTLKPFETKTTVVVFDKPGAYTYICHLPGHEQYGMRGTIKVTN